VHEAELARVRRAAEATVADEQARRTAAEAERDTLLASTTWRAAAPLRWAVSRLRRRFE
jgi:hypothetical protein